MLDIFLFLFFVLNITLINFTHVDIYTPNSHISHSIKLVFNTENILRCFLFVWVWLHEMTNFNIFLNYLARTQLKGKTCLHASQLFSFKGSIPFGPPSEPNNSFYVSG